MKFILQEAIKFILDERFILTEADKSDLYTEVSEKCKQLLDIVKKQLDLVENGDDDAEAKEQLLDKIITETDNLIIDTEKVKDEVIIKGNIAKYLQKVDNFLSELDPNYKTNDKSEIYKTIKALQDGKTIKDLKGAINSAHLFFNNYLDNLTTLKSSEKGENTKFDNTDQELILNDIYADLLKLSKVKPESFDKLSDASKKIINEKLTDLLNNKDNSYEFIKLCDSFHNGQLGTVIEDDLNVELSQDELDADRASRLDWGKQYKQAGDKDKFWADYFYSVWGQDAEKVKELGEAFKQECVVLGFTEDANPFIHFVKKYVVEGKYPITKDQYTAIHDMIANNTAALKVSDLANPKSPLKGGNMIIWYKDFYIKASNYDTVEEYLKLLGQVKVSDYSSLLKADTSGMNEATAKAYNNILSHFGGAKGNISDVLYTIFVEKQKLKDLVSTKGSGNACPAEPTAEKIRPIEDVNKLINILSLKNDNSKKAWSKSATSDLVAAITENPLFNKEPDKWAKKFLTQLIVIYASADQQSKYQKEKWWTAPEKDDDIIKIKQELESHGSDLNTTQIEQVKKAFEDEGWLK